MVSRTGEGRVRRRMPPMRTLTATLLLISLVSAAGALPAPPPLDHAPLVRERAATWLKPDDLVLGVEIAGDARAYPLSILERHAVANDTIDRIPVAVAWGRPCGSAVAYRTCTPKSTSPLAASCDARDGGGGRSRRRSQAPRDPRLRSRGARLQPLGALLPGRQLRHRSGRPPLEDRRGRAHRPGRPEARPDSRQARGAGGVGGGVSGRGGVYGAEGAVRGSLPSDRPTLRSLTLG